MINPRFFSLSRMSTNSSGMVLLMVMMAVIVLSIFVLNILSQNLSSSFSTQDQVHIIKAEQLAKGAFWKGYTDKVNGHDLSVPNETLDGHTYTISQTYDLTSKEYVTSVGY